MLRKTITVLSVVSLLCASVFAVHSVSANSPEGQLKQDNVQYDSGAMDCLDIKFKLGETHRTDRLLRVTLSESYDAMSSDLMGRLNSRIVENKLDGSELIRIASEFEEAHAQFKSNYTEYDDSMLDLIKANCQSRTKSYHEQIQETKALREKVHEDVQELNVLMQRYHDAFKDFRKDINTKEDEEEDA